MSGAHFGDRSEDFKRHIVSILKLGNVKNKYLNVLTSGSYLTTYSKVYTSKTVDIKNNYEVFEQKGDVSINKFIPWYMYNRFPKLNCDNGVSIVARLKIKYQSKDTLSKIAESLGMWPFITCTEEMRYKMKKSLLEDVLEAFIGATEHMFNMMFKVTVGFAIVEKILKSVFDNIKITLDYENLVDPKTRLKEIFDYNSQRLGKIAYDFTYDNKMTTTILYSKKNNDKKFLAKAQAALKATSIQNASQKAINNLKKMGVKERIPKAFKFLCEPEQKDHKITENQVNNKVSHILKNTFFTTHLNNAIRNRDIKQMEYLLKIGADVNEPDSSGLTSMDLIFIGEADVQTVKKMFDILVSYGSNKSMHKNVYDIYLNKYDFIKRISFKLL